MCSVCGCPGGKRCAKCKGMSYCSKEHQIIDWKAGHKRQCGVAESASAPTSNTPNLLFPEYELVMETESMDPENKPEKSESECMAEYTKFLKSQAAGSMTGNDKDLESMATSEDILDQNFKQFKKRIEKEPDQVLRYQKGGNPLWVSDKNTASSANIPDCECGAKRQFEFQILPQLLNYLDVTTVESKLDWGTLAVYTCVNSCDQGPKYHQEFVWKQDITEQWNIIHIESESSQGNYSW